MSRSYDVVVVGTAAMGGAVVYQLAKAGARVLGIDRFAPPHTHGSTHGDSRITRLALGEGAEYVPLALRSHELWREIEALTGDELLTVTGGVVISVPEGRGQHGADDFLAATIATARLHGVAHEVLDGAALAERSRVPTTNLPPATLNASRCRARGGGARPGARIGVRRPHLPGVCGTTAGAHSAHHD